MYFVNIAGLWMMQCLLCSMVLPIQSNQYDTVKSLLEIFEENSKLYHGENEQTNLLSEYDFIIVGAGTAGCVLANRLSEISDWKIFLAEAGDEENIIMDIPAIAGNLQFTPANWKYKTEPSDEYCNGFENKQCLWPRGKVLGGSSVLNFMIYTRGSRGDYDNWKSMGNDGWEWNDVLPYFKKIENYNIPSQFDPKYHGKNGNLFIEYAPFRTETGQAWIKAAQELGFKYVDYNGPEPSGVSYLQFTLKNGTRHSSNRAYLHHVRNRPNLHVSTKTLVTKLILDQSNTLVLGVEIETNLRRQVIYARKEVIISAGTINSPQLLMLSGIGPKDHLESMNIEIIKDLPVGQNLMDHIATGALHFVFNTTLPLNRNVYFLDEVVQWIGNRESSLSLGGGNEALVYMDHKDKFNTTLLPDVELLFLSDGSYVDLQKMFGFTEKEFSETFGSLSNLFMVLPLLMRPKSRGKILLQSRDPKTHPKIIPNYLDSQEDMEKILEGIRTAIDISKQPAMSKLGTEIYNVPVKKCLVEGDFGSDAYFACQTRRYTFTIYHHSGTCKMGSKNDPTAVVDPRLKVHGLKNLRVVDASIMPDIVSVHTNAPTYMIAEKGSDIVKQDWGIFTN